MEGRTLSLFPSREVCTPEVPVLLFPCEILCVLRGAGREMQGLLVSSSDHIAALCKASEMSMWGHQSLGGFPYLGAALLAGARGTAGCLLPRGRSGWAFLRCPG